MRSALIAKTTTRLFAVLIEENYLNDEKFAKQFVGGRFRIKQWGKKIKYALKTKGLARIVQKALKEIDKKEYLAVLKKLATEKYESLKQERNICIKKRKTMDYLIQKGYEVDLLKRH